MKRLLPLIVGIVVVCNGGCERRVIVFTGPDQPDRADEKPPGFVIECHFDEAPKQRPTDLRSSQTITVSGVLMQCGDEVLNLSHCQVVAEQPSSKKALNQTFSVDLDAAIMLCDGKLPVGVRAIDWYTRQARITVGGQRCPNWMQAGDIQESPSNGEYVLTLLRVHPNRCEFHLRTN